MEQAPIQKAAAVLAAPADQRVAAGLEADHGDLGAELPQVAHIAAVEAGFPAVARVPQAGTVGQVLSIRPLGIDFQMRRTGADKAVADATTERAPIGEQVQGLQNAGLARTIGSDQQVQGRVEHQAGVGHAAYVADLELLQDHG